MRPETSQNVANSLGATTGISGFVTYINPYIGVVGLAITFLTGAAAITYYYKTHKLNMARFELEQAEREAKLKRKQRKSDG